jgi:hypothetical protein
MPPPLRSRAHSPIGRHHRRIIGASHAEPNAARSRRPTFRRFIELRPRNCAWKLPGLGDQILNVGGISKTKPRRSSSEPPTPTEPIWNL